MKPEKRAQPVEFRIERRADKPVQLAGYAAVYNSLSEELWGFRERIAAGAFQGALKADVRALMNHDPNLILGRSSAGTLRLTEDERGLGFELDLPETQTARDLVVSIERKDITGMSFAFRTIKDTWNKVASEWLRTLLEVDLIDISPVTYPAYPDTSVAVRQLEQLVKMEELGAARRRRRARLAEIELDMSRSRA